MADAQPSGSELHLLTTDVLLAELIGGQSIALGGEETLGLSDDARCVLDWYRRNRARWTANLSADDIEAIVDTIGEPPPAMAASVEAGAPTQVRVLRLAKVVAHRFAGLHVFGKSSEPPDTFVFEPDNQITLLEGLNGSGKTSLANAIVWCLTGHLIRSQREPEQGPTEYECEIDRSGVGKSTHLISAVTPMPHGTSDLPASGNPIAADTWVEVTLADAEGNLQPPLLRRQGRSSRGKLGEDQPNFELIGIDPIAWRIATTMPALLPYLAVGEASQLGHAVARLTGLADLVDLAKHAGKASERIAKRRTKELETEKEDIEQRYSQTSYDLNELTNEHEDIAPETPVPPIEADDAQSAITEISRNFISLKAKALAQAQDILGDTFDPENKESRDNLEANIRPAIEQVSKLSELASIKRLSSLTLTPVEAEQVISLLAQLKSEAATLAELADNPDRARRAQLYARVSAWMHEHEERETDTCPVCIGSLKDARDPVSGESVVDHLAAAESDRETVARTIADWTSHWSGKLLQELPDVIGVEARRDLPLGPHDLLRAGFVDELFATPPFKGTLLALKPDAEKLVDERLATLPAYSEPEHVVLPEQISATASTLQRMIDRVVRAKAFADWRSASTEPLKAVVQAIRRGEDGAVDAERAVGARLKVLIGIVEGVAPLTTAITLAERLEANRAAYVKKCARIQVCGRAIIALDLLVPLGDLAQTQVDLLRTKLHNRAEFWRKAMFRNATQFAPDLTGTGMDANGVLELRVGREGVTAPAQHISNASALRGALLGFFLAFREHVLATRGGLALLLFDDPQELLDNDNRERLARGLASLAASGAQLVITTHDRKFARSLVAESRSEDRITHLSVHPVNAVRPTLAVSPAIEEVDRRRQAFHDNTDSAVDAQNYASDLRVFLESRLGDLFDDLAHPAFAAATKALTLNPLMDKLRGLVSSGAGELFTNPVVKKFAETAALMEGAEPRRVLNESHHDKASITYVDVQTVAADFHRLRTDIEKVHEQFRLYRWREPLTRADQPTAQIIALPPMVRPTFSVVVCPDIAAFVRSSPSGGSQDHEFEQLDGTWFEDKALFYVRGDTLGFAVPAGSVAIVEAEPYPGRDQNLVIAKHRDQILARRMVTSNGSIGISLAAQMPDPRTRRPTITYDASKVRLNRVVGALFTDMPPPPVVSGEAVPVPTVPELAQVTVAYRVKEESAVPLALPGQVILGGAELLPSDLDNWEGRLVAVTLDDGASIFKRVGCKLPGPLGYLRQFETIGGLGSSLIVATELVEDSAPIPIMRSARRVVGVLYDGT